MARFFEAERHEDFREGLGRAAENARERRICFQRTLTRLRVGRARQEFDRIHSHQKAAEGFVTAGSVTLRIGFRAATERLGTCRQRCGPRMPDLKECGADPERFGFEERTDPDVPPSEDHALNREFVSLGPCESVDRGPQSAAGSRSEALGEAIDQAANGPRRFCIERFDEWREPTPDVPGRALRKATPHPFPSRRIEQVGDERFSLGRQEAVSR